jgi:hypothetical protein
VVESVTHATCPSSHSGVVLLDVRGGVGGATFRVRRSDGGDWFEFGRVVNYFELGMVDPTGLNFEQPLRIQGEFVAWNSPWRASTKWCLSMSGPIALAVDQAARTLTIEAADRRGEWHTATISGFPADHVLAAYLVNGTTLEIDPAPVTTEPPMQQVE